MAIVEGAMNPMESIFHEKQEGSLCAQHCLNALLQGHYFTAVDLAEIARELDTMERQQMAIAGENSEEYRQFIQQPSNNYDDSGFFSIQVIQKALKVWNVELIPFTSSNEIAVKARQEPRTQKCYICNFREHWFTIRGIGSQWFNLNSLLTFPELVSDTYLSLLLTQLQQEGYSIFIVVGQLPDCDAEQILRVVPAVQAVKPRLIHESKAKSPGSSTGSSKIVDSDLQRALDESKRLVEENDESLKRALALSIESMPPDFAFKMPQTSAQSNTVPTSAGAINPRPDPEPSSQEIRQKRLAFYNKGTEQSTSESTSADIPTVSTSAGALQSTTSADAPTAQSLTNQTATHNAVDMTEEQMLQIAMEMSMEGGVS